MYSSVSIFLSTIPVFADGLCEVEAIRDVPAIENPSYVLKRGEVERAVTQYRINKKTGETSFCSHGGYCYPTHLVVEGRAVIALELTNCVVDQSAPESDSEMDIYGVEVDRARNSDKALRLDDIENRLLEMGSCGACADNEAAMFVYYPDSQCGRLVQRGLENHYEAIQELVSFPEYCIADWDQIHRDENLGANRAPPTALVPSPQETLAVPEHASAAVTESQLAAAKACMETERALPNSMRGGASALEYCAALVVLEGVE